MRFQNNGIRPGISCTDPNGVCCCWYQWFYINLYFFSVSWDKSNFIHNLIISQIFHQNCVRSRFECNCILQFNLITLLNWRVIHNWIWESVGHPLSSVSIGPQIFFFAMKILILNELNDINERSGNFRRLRQLHWVRNNRHFCQFHFGVRMSVTW